MLSHTSWAMAHWDRFLKVFKYLLGFSKASRHLTWHGGRHCCLVDKAPHKIPGFYS